MARKTLLTEAELRSFMKLAELTPLGADKIAEIYGTEEDLEEGEDRPKKKKPVREEEDDEDDDPAGMKASKPVREADEDDDEDPPGMYGKRFMEEEMDMDIETDKDVDDAAGDMDMKMDMDMDAPAAGGDSKMVSIDDFMGALEDALEQVLGDDVEVEMDDEEDDAMDAMDGMDSDDDAGMDDDPAGMAGPRGGMMEQEDIVNEVARRVAARLQDKKNKAEMVDQLAERILNRLTSK